MSAALTDTEAAIGVFGGSFDPVHFGHLRAALELALTFDLQTVRLIPNARPPHRDDAFVSADHRLQMLTLAVAQSPRLALDTREMDREGMSYTFDTLASLRAELGSSKPIIFGLGADAFAKISEWHRAAELLEQAHIAVLSRPGSEISADADHSLPFSPSWTRDAGDMLRQSHGLLYRLEMTPLAISSTRIRQQIARGWSPRFLLPESVCDYIAEHALYQTSA